MAALPNLAEPEVPERNQVSEKQPPWRPGDYSTAPPWRRTGAGGVEHPHDTPPYQFLPSPNYVVYNKTSFGQCLAGLFHRLVFPLKILIVFVDFLIQHDPYEQPKKQFARGDDAHVAVIARRPSATSPRARPRCQRSRKAVGGSDETRGIRPREISIEGAARCSTERERSSHCGTGRGWRLPSVELG